MTIEVGVPEDWTPKLTLTMAQLLHRAFRQGFPVIGFVRRDVTELRTIYRCSNLHHRAMGAIAVTSPCQIVCAAAPTSLARWLKPDSAYTPTLRRSERVRAAHTRSALG